MKIMETARLNRLGDNDDNETEKERVNKSLVFHKLSS